MSDRLFASSKLLVRGGSSEIPSFRERGYDVVLSALSWETRRDFSFKKLNRRFDKVTFLKFDSTHPTAEQRKMEQLKQAALYANHADVLELQESISFAPNIKLLDNFLGAQVNRAGRPIRVLCDISCIPKAYLLLLVGLGFGKGYFARLDCLYSNGKYALGKQHEAAASTSTREGSIISDGDWASLPIPFFEAEYTIPSARDVLVTLGGEVGLTLPFVEKYEPRRLGLVLITESEVQEPSRLPSSEQFALAELQAAADSNSKNIPLTDVVGLARYANEFCKSSAADVVTALAVGCKTHALGLAIVALSQPKMEIICRVPKRYTMIDVEPAGTVIGFEIEDRFEPNAYIS